MKIKYNVNRNIVSDGIKKYFYLWDVIGIIIIKYVDSSMELIREGNIRMDVLHVLNIGK